MTSDRRPERHFGIQLSAFTTDGEQSADFFAATIAAAQAAEIAQFDSFWLPDHFHQTPPGRRRDDPAPEAYVLLAALAQYTSRIRLGALVTGVTYRNPALLAKMVTTLDHVSRGRAVLGLGASWNADEYIAYGFGDSLPPLGERFERLEEAVQIAQAMFTQETAHVQGVHYRVAGALNVPRPLQEGGVPIMLGGAAPFVLRLAARGANMWNILAEPPSAVRKLGELLRFCDEVGRNPTEITKTWLGALPIVEGQIDSAAILAVTTTIFDAGFDGVMFYKARDLWTGDELAALGAILTEFR